MQGLVANALSSLTLDMRKVGTRMGMVFSIIAFTVLTGPPLAGFLIKKDGGKYVYSQLFAGTSMALGSSFIIAARIASTGLVLKMKV